MNNKHKHRAPDLPSLDLLGADLVRAAEQRPQGRAARRTRRRWAPIAAVATAAACTAVAVLVLLPGKLGHPQSQRPLAIGPSPAARPLPPTGVLLSSREGERCLVAGRLTRAQFTRLSLGKAATFAPPNCGVSASKTLVASQGLSSLAAITPQGETRVQPGKAPAFLLVVDSSS